MTHNTMISTRLFGHAAERRPSNENTDVQHLQAEPSAVLFPPPPDAPAPSDAYGMVNTLSIPVAAVKAASMQHHATHMNRHGTPFSPRINATSKRLQRGLPVEEMLLGKGRHAVEKRERLRQQLEAEERRRAVPTRGTVGTDAMAARYSMRWGRTRRAPLCAQVGARPAQRTTTRAAGASAVGCIGRGGSTPYCTSTPRAAASSNAASAVRGIARSGRRRGVATIPNTASAAQVQQQQQQRVHGRRAGGDGRRGAQRGVGVRAGAAAAAGGARAAAARRGAMPVQAVDQRLALVRDAAGHLQADVAVVAPRRWWRWRWRWGGRRGDAVEQPRRGGAHARVARAAQRRHAARQLAEQAHAERLTQRSAAVAPIDLRREKPSSWRRPPRRASHGHAADGGGYAETTRARTASGAPTRRRCPSGPRRGCCRSAGRTKIE